jgi:hypothetical protein
MIERRQTERILRLVAEDATKSRADFVRFLDRNHPSARLVGVPVVATERGGTARVMLTVALQWRTIGGRPSRSVNFEATLDPLAGGWAIRQIRFPAGFSQ